MNDEAEVDPGGRQGEPVEGSLTDGGSLPGSSDEDRSFGAGRRGRDHTAEIEADGGAASVAGVLATQYILDGQKDADEAGSEPEVGGALPR